MKKRVLVTLLAFCLVAALCVVGAAASGPLPGSNVATAADFEAALEAGGEVTLTGNITISEKMDIVVTQPVTLNLNGNTVTKTYSETNHHFIVIENGGSLTINDTGGGKLEATGSYGYGIRVNSGGTLIVNSGTLEANQEVIYTGYGTSNARIEINGGTIQCTGYDSALQLSSPSGLEVNITGGEIISPSGNAIFASGVYNGDLDINISGGTLTGGQWTVYVSEGADVTVSGDAKLTTTGNTGSIFMDASTYYPSSLTIEGGTIEGDYVAVDVEGYSQVTMTGGSITTERSSAMELSENATAEILGGTLTTTASAAALNVTGSATAAISGGTFNGGGTDETALSGSTEQVTVTGGTFSSDVSSYIPSGAALEQNSGTGEVGTPEGVDVVAEINDVPYATLQDAVDAANGTEGTTTINLVRNATGSGIKVQSGNDLIFDLGGFTYTVNSGVGSGPQYATNCFQLLQNSDITIRNGTIEPEGIANLAIVIQNYSNLTLEDVVLDGRPLRDTAGKEYTLSNNNGEININAGTVIYSNGGEGDMAMDVCWASSYQNGARVTVNEGALIDGDVELGLWNQTAYADNQSVLTMNGGTITGEVTIMVEGSNYGSTEEAIEAVKTNVTINGGTYGGSVDAYIDSPNEANAKVTADGQHSYFSTLAEAQQAAAGNPNAVVTDLSVKPASGTTYTVTLNYNDGRSPISATIVAAGDNYVLPTPVRSGYTFNGWRLGSSAYYKGGGSVRVTSDMTFTAVWDLIEIPDTYEINVSAGANGEASTSLTNASAGSTVTITATPDEGYRVGSVTVTGPDGRVEVTRVNATTYTFVMPEGAVDVTVRFEEANALSEPFTDVNEGQWFYEYVAYVYSNGLMEGTSATTFEPDTGMTRAMVWAVLARMDGQSVSGASWMETARNWAMSEGVSDGTDPSGLITREQLATMLYRYAGSPAATGNGISAFTDAGSVSSWAVGAMNWALSEGIITGMGGGTLAPQGTATRAQAAAILMRFVER